MLFLKYFKKPYILISILFLVPDEVEDSIFLEESEAVLRSLEASSISDKTEDPIKTTEGQQSVSTKTSVASSKSDAGTNTSTDKTITASTASNLASKNCDQWGNIRTIDELYTHCEQLVETLSQASEELKNGSKEANCQVQFFVILGVIHKLRRQDFANF